MATSFFKAIGHGDLSKISEGIEFIGHVNKKGESALHVAIAENQMAVVEFLLNQPGLPVDVREKKHGFTPIMMCLVTQTSNCITLLEMILTKVKPDLALKDNSDNTALHLSIQYDLDECSKLLIKKGSPVEAVNDQGLTPAHIAAAKGNLEILKILIENHHANINATDNNGNSIIHRASMGETDQCDMIFRYLIERKIKFVSNKDGNTPLHTEALHCDPNKDWPSAAAALLLAEDASLETQTNRKGQTAKELLTVDAEKELPLPSPKKQLTKTKKQPLLNPKESEDIQAVQARAALAAAAVQGKKKKKRQGEEEDEKVKEVVNTASPFTYVILVSCIVGFFAVLYALLAYLAK